ncbi:MAG TPA: hypothetical protein PKC18_21355, partial [Lacipirellulaceae bacterium]|nr:hypothetical protein [Lacipirellulaceae bacterium]
DGAMGGPHVRRLEVRATLAGTGSAGSASLSVEQFQMTSALLAWARPQLPAAINQIRVEAMLDGQAALQWFADGRPPRVDAELAVSEGRVDDALLPAPITELAGQIVVAGDQLQVRNMRGKCGAAEVGAAVNRSGWAPRAPLAAVLTATDAVLDDALYQSLRRFDAAGLAVAGELVEQWDRFDPAGVVDGTLQVTFDSQRWTPTALLTGRQLSFQSEKFPYRLTEGTGVIRYTPPTATAPDLVDVEMTARGGGQPLRIVGQVIDPQPGAAGWAQITGEALDIEQRMIAAIASEKCRDVISELHPSGRFNVNWRIERATPGAEPRTALRLDLTDVRINYDRFPYPLRGIRGTMTAQDDLWTFTDLVSGGRRPVRGSDVVADLGGTDLARRGLVRRIARGGPPGVDRAQSARRSGLRQRNRLPPRPGPAEPARGHSTAARIDADQARVLSLPHGQCFRHDHLPRRRGAAGRHACAARPDDDPHQWARVLLAGGALAVPLDGADGRQALAAHRPDV